MLKDYQAALQSVEQAVTLAPQSAYAHFVRGKVHLRFNDIDMCLAKPDIYIISSLRATYSQLEVARPYNRRQFYILRLLFVLIFTA
jgi:hypothetical protein